MKVIMNSKFYHLSKVYDIVQMLVKSALMTLPFRILMMSYSLYALVFLYFFRSGDSLDSNYRLVINKLTNLKANSFLLTSLRTESLSFRLFDFFCIDSRLILAIYSLSVSYVIVLIQFEYGV